ncbi:sensor histidine kinase [Burkholderia cepacia]|uniref:sensor histidine kinase n=1 Tax=Burkholderia cepacia TaxID=292 RepID=UPI00158AE31B|nr:sensor histidine kinase [Burkholderia cepacia]
MKSHKLSLRVRLLLWLILPMTAFGLIAAWVMHANARRTADLLQDEALLAAARVMAADVRWSGDSLVASVSPSTIQIVGTPEGDQVFYRVEIEGGAVIAGTSDFPSKRLTGSLQWYDAKVADLPIRAVSLERPMYDDGRTIKLLVSVGRTLTARDALTASFWKPQGVYILGSIAVAIVLICAGLAHELRPLNRLAIALNAHPLQSRARIDSSNLHVELRPLVAAFNASLDMIERQTSTQRRFIADAAHQIRTPLSVLGSQLQYARRQHSLEDVRKTLAAMHHSNRAMVTLINQLLMLAQAESADYAAFESEAVDFEKLITRAVEKLALVASRRDIELAVSFGDALVIKGSESLLSAAVSNLIDNAIRYSPNGTRVTIEATRTDSALHVSVIDEGPGIPVALRERVFEPFFRASEAEGSGLGLTIAKEIVRAHGGTIAISEASPARGAKISLIFRL